jgi:hypothetical protein
MKRLVECEPHQSDDGPCRLPALLDERLLALDALGEPPSRALGCQRYLQLLSCAAG